MADTWASADVCGRVAPLRVSQLVSVAIHTPCPTGGLAGIGLYVVFRVVLFKAMFFKVMGRFGRYCWTIFGEHVGTCLGGL